MTRIGYGLLRVDNQQPIGIWPLPLDECTKRKRRYEATTPFEYHIVPVYYGDPVANEKPQTFAGRAK